MNLVGPQNVVNTAKKMGIESPLDPVLSLALGVSDVSLYELVGAYSTFVNKGTWTEPYYITKIEDKYGNVLQDFVPKRREALSEESAYLMLHMLRGAVEEEGGTGRRLDYYYQFMDEDNEIGAKTGTTQNYSDGWFVGVTKDLVAGAWVGGDDRAIHFPSIVWGQGARMAMPIWAEFMGNVYADTTLNITKGPFERPRFELAVELDCSAYGFVNPLADTLEIQEPSIEEITEDEIF
jgi:penicillin-binding protein 1A